MKFLRNYKNMKKIKLSSIKKEARFRDYKDAFFYLDDAMIVNTCFNASEPSLGLRMHSLLEFVDFKNPDYSVLKKGEYASVHNQTTLIQDALNPIYDVIRKYYSHVKIINDICFATKKRQQALDEVSDEDFIIVIGDKISSNSTRLFELAKQKYPNKRVFLVNSLDEVKRINFSKNEKGFITAGASTPKEVINPIIEYLKSY